MVETNPCDLLFMKPYTSTHFSQSVYQWLQMDNFKMLTSDSFNDTKLYLLQIKLTVEHNVII